MAKNSFLWLVLIALTLLSFFLTESSTLSWGTAAILALAAVKGGLIVDGFMELNGVTHVLRSAMLLYCPVVGGIIFFILTK
ncbi:MAG: cytochrome C oxidase subunit IV family protein [Motiliproteus sp.]